MTSVGLSDIAARMRSLLIQAEASGHDRGMTAARDFALEAAAAFEAAPEPRESDAKMLRQIAATLSMLLLHKPEPGQDDDDPDEVF